MRKKTQTTKATKAPKEEQKIVVSEKQKIIEKLTKTGFAPFSEGGVLMFWIDKEVEQKPILAELKKLNYKASYGFRYRGKQTAPKKEKINEEDNAG